MAVGKYLIQAFRLQEERTSKLNPLLSTIVTKNRSRDSQINDTMHSTCSRYICVVVVSGFYYVIARSSPARWTVGLQGESHSAVVSNPRSTLTKVRFMTHENQHLDTHCTSGHGFESQNVGLIVRCEVHEHLIVQFSVDSS